MKIWLLQIGETLPLNKESRRLRTAIVAEKLAQRGHKVVWWASALDHIKKKWIYQGDQSFLLAPNFEIKALKGMKYKKNISLSRFLDHRLIARKFRKMAPTEAKPDLILASFPSYDLAYEGVRYAKANGIPVLLDIRDQWPDTFLNHVPASLQLFAKFCLTYEFHLARSAMIQSDGLLSMMESLLQWGLNYAQREKTWKDKAFYLGYQRLDSSSPASEKIAELLPRLKNKFVVTYIGTFTDYQNPRILVECASRLAHTDVIFVLAGEGLHSSALRALAANLPNVIFPGWLNDGDIFGLLGSSSVGVCPTTKKIDSFPNKAFTYFSGGLPVISSSEGDLRQLLEKHQLGFYYPHNQVEILMRHLLTLYEEHSLYSKMRESVKANKGRLFDGEMIYEDYVDHLEKIKSLL